MAQQYVKDTPSSRVLLVGSPYDADCRSIRSFLSANRVQYDWVDSELEPERASSCIPLGTKESAVMVDGTNHLPTPTVRAVAEALGLQTTPKDERYELVIAGAGPAGMAAGVYGASEGLKVLIVERSAAGGQAGTSSRIENYLGFPSGISGDELTERALKQARHFGSEIAVTRSIEAVLIEDTGYCVQLDGGERIRARAILLAPGSIGGASKWADWIVCWGAEYFTAPLVRRPTALPGRGYSWSGVGTLPARPQSSSPTTLPR